MCSFYISKRIWFYHLWRGLSYNNVKAGQSHYSIILLPGKFKEVQGDPCSTKGQSVYLQEGIYDEKVWGETSLVVSPLFDHKLLLFIYWPLRKGATGTSISGKIHILKMCGEAGLKIIRDAKDVWRLCLYLSWSKPGIQIQAFRLWGLRIQYRETQGSLMGFICCCCYLESPESIGLDLMERYMEAFYVEALPIFWNEGSHLPSRRGPWQGRI